MSLSSLTEALIHISDSTAEISLSDLLLTGFMFSCLLLCDYNVHSLMATSVAHVWMQTHSLTQESTSVILKQ